MWPPHAGHCRPCTSKSITLGLVAAASCHILTPTSLLQCCQCNYSPYHHQRCFHHCLPRHQHLRPRSLTLPQIQYSTFEKHFHPRVQVWAVNPAPKQHLKSTSKAIRISLLIPFHSGDVDAIVPFTGTRSWLDKLALPVEAAFRPWFLGKQTGGYVTKFAPISSPAHSIAAVCCVERSPRAVISVLNLAPCPRYNGLTFATVRNAGDVLVLTQLMFK